PGVVTRTSAAPAAPAGVVAVSMTGDATLIVPAAAAPIDSVVDPARKFVPRRVTKSPPVVAPLCGVMEKIEGGGMYVYAPASVAVPPCVATTTSAVPALPAGTVTSNSVEEM